MRSPEAFDAFYAATRDRLLHETYALTGDVPASRAAVRDAYVVAWHHWRAVGVLEDREGWVRAQAHRRGRRRRTARPWHRDRSVEPGALATLDALAKLTGPQRRLLVLTNLCPLSLQDLARSVEMPGADAERELQTASAQFALHREVPTTEVRALLEDLREPLGDGGWPRATIIRRAGTTRRRGHTAAGAGLATLVLLIAGFLVVGGAGAQVMSLQSERVAPAVPVTQVADEPDPEAGDSSALSEDALLTDDQVVRFGRELDWSATSTSDNLDGDGLVLPCQRERFADPKGDDALVRTWKGSETVREPKMGKNKAKKGEQVTRLRSEATQVVELSKDERRAEQAFETASLWFAGCLDPRTQLLSTRTLSGIGDTATQYRFRTWGATPTDMSVSVARSGRLVLTTLVRDRDGRRTDDRTATTGIAAAVNAACGTGGAGTCAGPARGKAVDPVAVGIPPGLLLAVDLPPVAIARGPWVGTDPVKARENLAATRCDRTSFQGKGIRRSLTRTFLFPETPQADHFGLTQTTGVMTPPAAKKFVSRVRAQIADCGGANLGTSVTSLADRSSQHTELHAWALSIEVSDEESFPFFMAILRDGNTVSQVGFTPDGKMTMTRGDFVSVAERALQRLDNLPGAQR